MHIKPISYSYPKLNLIKDKTAFFESLKVVYSDLKDSEYFKEARKPALFVYRIQTKTRIYHGILAGVDIEDYLDGKILKHENTLIEQEKKILTLTHQRKAIIKPVLLAYKLNSKINALIAKAFLGKQPKLKLKFEKDQQIHELFAVESTKDIKAFQKEFKSKIEKSYIADGHHRMSAIKLLLEENPELRQKGLNHILCALFSFNELDILAYNRVVRILDLIDIDIIIKQLAHVAQIKKITSSRLPSRKGEVIMYSSQGNYSIQFRKDLISAKKEDYPVRFDIDLFNEHIAIKIFDIQDIRSTDRIEYIEAVKGNKLILKKIQENPDLLGFAFYPIKKNHFIKVANKNMILPPKSTWFEPRIRNGLVIQKILD